MPTEAEFLHAIAQQPDDDELRLVYADWLMEHGDAARGEFVQAQVELARLDFGDPRRQALADRADDLLAEHEERWLAPLPASLAGWRWQRGLLERVILRDEPSLASLPALLQRHPLAEVHVDVGANEADQLRSSPHLRSVAGLNPRTWQLYDDLASLLTSPELAGLRSLNIKFCLSLGRLLNLAPTLAFAPHLHTLGAGEISDTEATRLTGESPFPSLREFSHDRINSQDETPPALLEPPAARWTRLDVMLWRPRHLLRLSACTRLVSLRLECDDEQPAAQVSLPPSLQRLDLGGRDLGRWIRELAALPDLPPLRWLSLFLSGIEFTPVEWQALDALLARLPDCQLRLWLHRGNEVLLSFLALPCRTRLTSLLLNNRLVTDAEIEALAEREQLAGLRELYISYTGQPLTEQQLSRLADSPGLAGLRSLSLALPNLGYKPLDRLLRSPHLRRLRSLALDVCGIGERGLGALLRWPGLGRLRWLSLCNNHLDERAGARLERSALSPLVRVLFNGNQHQGFALKPEHLQGLQERLGQRLLFFYSNDDYRLRESFFGAEALS
jgi:uncharacterized protein (TIGR02996 family)